MKTTIFLCCLIVFTVSLHSSHNEETLVGAYTEQDPKKIDGNLQQIDSYLRQTFPALKDKQLIQASTQVVEGINYRYKYALDTESNSSLTFTVWDRPWLGERQITEVRKESFSEGMGSPKVEVIEPNDNNYNQILGLFL